MNPSVYLILMNEDDSLRKVTPCSLEHRYQCFGGTLSLYLQHRKLFSTHCKGILLTIGIRRVGHHSVILCTSFNLKPSINKLDS